MAKTATEPVDIVTLLEQASEDTLVDLEARIKAKQEALDAHIRKAEGEIGALELLRRTVDIKLHGKPLRKKHERKAKTTQPAPATSPAVGGWPKPGSVSEMVVDIIRRHGPGTAESIGGKLGMSPGSVNMAMAHSNGKLIKLANHKIALAGTEED